MWTQASLSPESGSNSKGDRLAYAHVIWDHYKDEYNAVFSDTPLPEALDPEAEDADRFPPHGKPKKTAEDPDGPWEGMTEADQHAINVIAANQGKAVAAYERLLVSGNAPFDKFVAGEQDAISLSAQRGLKLFIGKAACVACHSGPTFSDQQFYNTAVPQLGPHIPEEDAGRYDDISSVLSHEFNTSSVYSDDRDTGKLDDLEEKESDLGAFRTKQLRNVAESAPYLHTGRFETLREVVAFYKEGGATSGFSGQKHALMVPLNLTEAEIDDIVAFLMSLTGEPIPEELTRNTAND
jgi:cytochrome c peroxidase